MTFDPLAFLLRRNVIGETCSPVCSPLTGGYWNDVFRIVAGDDDLVLKHFGGTRVASTLFPIMPESEARALQVLSGRDVAPEPVGFWPAAQDHGPVLVYRFVPGTMWQGDMAEAAALLARIHATPAGDFRFMPVTPQEVLDDADRLPRPPEDDPAWQRLMALRPAVAAVPPLERRVLIHADCSAGNMIAGPDGVRCIDWQCPGMGDGAEDLFSFLSPAFQILYDREPWQSDAVRRCRDAYGDAATLARLDAMLPFFAWRFAAYCVFRTHQLDGVDGAGSDRYRRAAAAEISVLEGLG
jgi:thiamine kinase